MSTTTPIPANSLPGRLRAGLSAILVFAACWASAIWYWRGSAALPATSHVLLLLFVLPLGLISAFWFGSRLLQRQAPAPAAAALPAALPHAVIARATPTVALLASALRMPFGASITELAQNKAHGDIDTELVDDKGFPIMSARSDEAVDAALRDEIGAWLAAQGMGDLRFGDDGWRALTLGTAVMRDLAGQAAALRDAEASVPLHLLAALPPDWPPAQRQAATAWWTQIVSDASWPAVHQHTAEQAPATLLAQAVATPGLTILLACASYLSQDTVDRWSEHGLLYTPANANGQIPGEGAAGLLLADTALAAAQGRHDAVHLDLEVDAGEPAPGAQKRFPPQRLVTLAERVLQGAAVPPSDIALVVADTGADSRHVLELMAFSAAAAPHLDQATDIVRVGPACGACVTVPFVAALAMAGQLAIERGAPLLCVSNDVPALRAVALVRHGLPS